MVNYSEYGVQFTVGTADIATGGRKIARAQYKLDENGNILGPQKVVNSIDIDWNSAQIPGITTPITSTGQLLKMLGDLYNGSAGGGQCDCPKFITIDAEDYAALETYEQDAIYFILGDAIEGDEEDENDDLNIDTLTTNLYVNDEPHTESTILLTYGQTYKLTGTLRGTIMIEIPANVTPADYTTLILDGVTIVSDEDYAIEYKIPEGAKKQKGLNIVVEKNSFNRIVCLKEVAAVDNQPGAIYSMNNLNIQGAGYLAIQNKGGHGIRGKETSITNLHLWCDASHDGIHGKNINIIGGTYYFENCNDAFGTADNQDDPESGHILYYDGKIKYHTLGGQLLDSKKIGIYFNEDLLTAQDLLNCTNMNLISKSVFNTYIGKSSDAVGNILYYSTREDYKKLENGTPLNLSNITETITYGEGATAITMQAYVIRYPWIQINGYLDKPIYFTPDVFGTNNASVKLNNSYLTHANQLHTVLYNSSRGNVHLFSVQDTLNIIENTYIDEVNVQLECDAVKSENNIEIEAKDGSTLFITSASTDGLDGGEVRITDSKGTIIISGCGQRGIKGNAIVPGPNAIITASSITAYYTDSTDTSNYTTFDGLLYVKNNCKVCAPTNLSGSTYAEHNESGFADIFARNGKSASKGVFGTTNNELKGYLITDSIGAILRMDLGNAEHLYYNRTFTSENHSTIITNDPGVANESVFAYNLNHYQIH